MPDSLTPLDGIRLMIEQEIPKLNYYQWPLLRLLTKRDAFQEVLKWDADVGGVTTGGRATDGANEIAASQSVVAPASLPIGLRTFGNTFNVTRTAIAQARTTAPGALAALFEYKVNDHLGKLLTDLNTLLYVGDGSTASHDVVGLNTVAAATTYANVSSATYPAWSSILQTNATPRALTRPLLGAMHKALMERGGMYDVIVTSFGLTEEYDKLFLEHTQINIAPMGFADLGFTGYAYKGRPIVADANCPAGTIYFINTRGVYFNSFNLAGTATMSVQSEPTKTEGICLSVSEVRNRNPDVLTFELSVKPQLQVLNRRKDLAVLNQITG
jgi:hypothetical protein